MHLFELAYSCRLYGHFSGFDKSLTRLRERVSPELDPRRADHRAWLFEWLNSWGCRQFAKKHHSTIASTSLVNWAEEWLATLPSSEVHLTDLSRAELQSASAAYAALRDGQASQRLQPSGRLDTVAYGPAGAAKTLFALRPNVFPPWDEPIRAQLRLGGDASSFQSYLTSVAEQLRLLSIDANVPVAALPELVDRANSSPPKLIDEYNWVVITRRCPPPTRADALRWAEWATKSAPEVA